MTYVDSIRELLEAQEGEHTQFKEAKNRFDFGEAAKCCCACAKSWFSGSLNTISLRLSHEPSSLSHCCGVKPLAAASGAYSGWLLMWLRQKSCARVRSRAGSASAVSVSKGVLHKKA